MDNMTKETSITFYTEGVDWNTSVEVDTEIFEDERSQLIEAATKSIEQQMEKNKELNVGVMVLVRRSKKSLTPAMVNSYICLNNAGQYEEAEILRENFKKTSNPPQDLADDEVGFSY